MTPELATYIVNFILYELEEYGRALDTDMILRAVEAYNGGAR